jgi:hypothetical protein
VNDPTLLADEIEARVAALPVRSTEAIRALRREYSKRLRTVPADEILTLAYELLRRKHPCGGLAACTASSPTS